MAEAKTARGALKARPMSPHLQVYSPLINMMMSILHRITGAALYFGTVLLAAWLAALAAGPGYYDMATSVLGSLPFKLVLLGYTWALINHALGGIRHFIWDTGRGYALGTIDLLCWGTLVLSLALTLALWALSGQLTGLLGQLASLFTLFVT